MPASSDRLLPRRRAVTDYLAPRPTDYLPTSAPRVFDYLAPPPEAMRGGGLVIRNAEPAQLRHNASGGPTLEGRMVPYNEWTEINSSVEGHFLERFAPGALARTLGARARSIRVLFEHGNDNMLGRQPIASIDEMRDEHDGAYYRASLLDGLPALLVSGLRRGLYGSSVRFGASKLDRVRSPGRSAHNPNGIPERTIREALIKEFSVVTFPQYQGATAIVRVHNI